MVVDRSAFVTCVSVLQGQTIDREIAIARHIKDAIAVSAADGMACACYGDVGGDVWQRCAEGECSAQGDRIGAAASSAATGGRIGIGGGNRVSQAAVGIDPVYPQRVKRCSDGRG